MEETFFFNNSYFKKKILRITKILMEAISFLLELLINFLVGLGSINRGPGTVAVSTNLQSTPLTSTTTHWRTFSSPRPTSYKDFDLNRNFKSSTKKTGRKRKKSLF